MGDDQGFVGELVEMPFAMPGEEDLEIRLDALIKLEVACRLAIESLPKLPSETEDTLRKPIETLCEVTERELERLKPGLLQRDADSS
jgi:hypothetical protein